MDQKELDGAADALCAWFESQEIGHSDGAMVIARVISSMLVTVAKSHDDLLRMIAEFNRMITVATETTFLIKVMNEHIDPEDNV